MVVCDGIVVGGAVVGGRVVGGTEVDDVGGGGGASVVVVVSGGGAVVAVGVGPGGDVWGGEIWAGPVRRGAVVATRAWVVTEPPAGAVVVGAAVEEVEPGEKLEVVAGPAVVGVGSSAVVGDWSATGWRNAVSSPVATSNSMAERARAARAYNPTLNR